MTTLFFNYLFQVFRLVLQHICDLYILDYTVCIIGLISLSFAHNRRLFKMLCSRRNVFVFKTSMVDSVLLLG